jgi:hypothetical protein
MTVTSSVGCTCSYEGLARCRGYSKKVLTRHLLPTPQLRVKRFAPPNTCAGALNLSLDVLHEQVIY